MNPFQSGTSAIECDPIADFESLLGSSFGGNRVAAQSSWEFAGWGDEPHRATRWPEARWKARPGRQRQPGAGRNPFQPLLAGSFHISERCVEREPEEIGELRFDATEQTIPRPTRRQKRHDSGRRKGTRPSISSAKRGHRRTASWPTGTPKSLAQDRSGLAIPPATGGRLVRHRGGCGPGVPGAGPA
jgi:hypothetical protein